MTTTTYQKKRADPEMMSEKTESRRDVKRQEGIYRREDRKNTEESVSKSNTK
jgi:hypothetical protein